MAPAQLPPLSFGGVLAQSLRSLRSGWLWFLGAVVVVLGAGLLFQALPLTHYQRGSHAVGPFLYQIAATLASDLRAFAVYAFVIAVCLELAQGKRATHAFSSMFATLPALAFLWLLENLGEFLELWDLWSSPEHPTPASIAVRLMAIELISLLISLISLVGFGLLPAVILDRRMGFRASVVETWRLMERMRLKLLGLFLLAMLLEILALSFNVLWTATIASHPGVFLFRNPYVSWGFAIIDWVSDVLWAVVLASSYLERVRDRDGILANEVAHVFA